MVTVPRPGCPAAVQASPVGSDLFGNLFDGLAQQVSEHVGSRLSRLDVGIDVAGRRHPDRQFLLDGTGQGAHLHVALGPRKTDGLTAPQALDDFRRLEHHLLGVGEILRPDREIRWRPAGSHRNSHATV